jgi:hypothetical protein
MQNILKELGMKDAKPIKTLMGTNGHLDLDVGGKSVDQKVYRPMIYMSIFREPPGFLEFKETKLCCPIHH